MKHKLLTALLVLVSVLCLSFGLAACNGGGGGGGENSGGLHYELNSDTDTYTVSADGKISGELVIPESYKGKPVTAISSYGFQSCPELTSVVIPDSVTSLGENMFSYCPKLTSVKIGSGVKSIGEAAFAECTGLTSITIPDSVTTIEASAFYGCSGLTSIVIPNSVTTIGDYTFSECTGLTSVVIGNGVTSIGESAFSGCTRLKSISIPDNVTSIESFAFAGCSGLTNIEIGDGVTSIGWYAFDGCAGLLSVTIPESVTSIGISAFRNCTDLESVTWNAENCTVDGDDPVFEGCANLKTVTFGENVKTIPGYLFIESKLKNVTIEDGVTSISRDAFDDCLIESATIPAIAIEAIRNLSLKTVVITNGEIGVKAFRDCIGLRSVTIESGVTLIGREAFSQCYGLQDLVIENGVTTIGEQAFYNCFALTELTIPESITTIEENAFEGCYKLIEICDKSQLKLSSRSQEHGKVAYYALNVYKEEDKRCLTLTEEGFLFYEKNLTCILLGYRGDATELTFPQKSPSGKSYTIYDCLFSGCSQLEHVTLPNNLTFITRGMFCGCSGLTDITIPKNVTEIKEYAFRDCKGLTSIEIPKSVITIGNYAFYNSGLTSITIPEGVTSIGEYAFYANNNMASVIWNAENCTEAGKGQWGPAFSLSQNLEVTFGDTVKRIPDNLFYNCRGVTSIIIPDSVTQIGERAFEYCTGLTSVVIGRGVTEIGGGAFLNCTDLERIVWNAENCTRVYSFTNYTVAFKGCKNLKEVIFGETVKTIPDGALLETAFYDDPTNWDGRGVLYIGDCLIEAKNTISGSYVIPENTRLIANGAFSGCKDLTSIEIPEGVASIGASTFSGCSGLTSVKIPKSVTSIGNYAFSDCNNLQTVYFTGTDAQWSDIEIGVGNDPLIKAKQSKPVVPEYKSAVENSFAAQSYHVTITSETLNTKIDQKLDFAGNIEYSEVTMGGKMVLKLYRAVEDGKVYVYSDRSGNWLRAQIEADAASFIRSQDAFASFKTAWESAGGSVKYDSATGEYSFGDYVFTLKDDRIATIKDTKAKVEYAFSENGAASLTLPALGQVDAAEKEAFITAMKNSIEAANFHMEFTITSGETEMLFSTDVNAGTAALSTGSVSFNGVNYPMMQVYREYANGTLNFMQRQADMSSGMPSVNPKWGAWMKQQSPAPEIVRLSDLYVCHPAFMLTGGRSDDASLELMYILSSRGAGNTYDFFNYDLRTMQASNCSFKIENGFVSQVVLFMRDWLDSLGAEGDSLVIEYSNYNETTVTKPSTIALTAALPVSRKEI